MMKTISFLAAATSAALVTPALADTFVDRGVTYVYAVEQRGNVRVITGEDATHHQPFILRVAHGWVEGTVDGQPVSFSTRDVVHVRPEVIVNEVAAR